MPIRLAPNHPTTSSVAMTSTPTLIISFLRVTLSGFGSSRRHTALLSAPGAELFSCDACCSSTRSTAAPVRTPPRAPRSEEHTSELQSRENLVCRLLLEKKKGRAAQALGDALA